MVEKPESLESHGAVKKSKYILWPASVFIVITIVVAVGMYSWHYLRSSCEMTAVQDASAFLIVQAKRYDGVYQVATDAPRDSVVIPVTVLQQILMDTKEVAVPVCMQPAKTELVSYMGVVIRAFLAYSAKEANSTVADMITQAETHYENYLTEMSAVKKCAPMCLP